ncbi:hypothetical protein ACSBR2_028980 [Camellia fascicularis]
MILKCRRTTGHVVLPVFYHVDPSHVRNQMECFKEAFTRHEERFHTEGAKKKDEWKGKIQEWRVALREAANFLPCPLLAKHYLHHPFWDFIIRKVV